MPVVLSGQRARAKRPVFFDDPLLFCAEKGTVLFVVKNETRKRAGRETVSFSKEKAGRFFAAGESFAGIILDCAIAFCYGN